MAIHPLLQGIEVAICVNRVPLQEYEDDDSWPGAITSPAGHSIKTITKYVESTADQEFGIMFKFDHTFNFTSPSLVVDSSIDGTTCDSLSILPTSFGRPFFREGVSKPVKGTEKWVLMPYKFTNIQTTLNADALQSLDGDKKKVADSGRIVVEVYRGSEPIKKPRSTTARTTSLGIDSSTGVHEKALKGDPKYHGASLGNAKPTTVSDYVTQTTRIDGKDSPILRVTFKYRSNKALKELLIIERTPDPESDDDLEIVDGADVKGSGSQKAKVKRELENDGETWRQKKKPKSSEEIECIDLTDD